MSLWVVARAGVDSAIDDLKSLRSIDLCTDDASKELCIPMVAHDIPDNLKTDRSHFYGAISE